VAERVLDADFVRAAVANLNEQLAQQAPSLRNDLDETRRRPDEVDKSIHIPLDLAEQFGLLVLEQDSLSERQNGRSCRPN
jgi:hypothetical protein